MAHAAAQIPMAEVRDDQLPRPRNRTDNGDRLRAKENRKAVAANEPLKRPEPLYDPIFFRKIDIKVGINLLYKGRLQPNTFWKVIDIKSDRGIGKGMRSVLTVHKLTDYLVVRNGSGETRRMSFAYASYSAIWQLPRN